MGTQPTAHSGAEVSSTQQRPAFCLSAAVPKEAAGPEHRADSQQDPPFLIAFIVLRHIVPIISTFVLSLFFFLLVLLLCAYIFFFF